MRNHHNQQPSRNHGITCPSVSNKHCKKNDQSQSTQLTTQSARTACAIPSHQHQPANTNPWIPQPSTSHPLIDTATHNSHKITKPNQEPKAPTIHIISAQPPTSWHNKPPTSNNSYSSAHQTDQLQQLPTTHTSISPPNQQKSSSNRSTHRPTNNHPEKLTLSMRHPQQRRKQINSIIFFEFTSFRLLEHHCHFFLLVQLFFNGSSSY